MSRDFRAARGGCRTPFNYPTLAESYKVAALDATNRLRQLDHMGD